MYFPLFLTVFVQHTNNHGQLLKIYFLLKFKKFHKRILMLYFISVVLCILVKGSELLIWISVFQLVNNVHLFESR